MQSLKVHSNESACRKIDRLGMEQVMVLIIIPNSVLYYTPSALSLTQSIYDRTLSASMRYIFGQTVYIIA